MFSTIKHNCEIERMWCIVTKELAPNLCFVFYSDDHKEEDSNQVPSARTELDSTQTKPGQRYHIRRPGR